ncbi:MAG: heparinase II/III family protein, partial [Puniceicoccaceae bacterium]
MSSLFLSAQEKEVLKHGLHIGEPLNTVFWPLERRARRICEEPGWSHRGTTVQWWHAIADYTMAVAGTHALRPSHQKAAWLRETAMAIARRPEQEWVGPAFRSHDPAEPVGNLETAHLTWAVAFALDLTPEVFTDAERDELLECLREKSLPLCRRWFEQRNGQNNRGMILLAGLTLSGAILQDGETLRWCADEYRRRLKLFQDDGSYGEGLQYASYAAYGLILTGEALRRADPERFSDLTLEPIARTPRWWAHALLYSKPLQGWGALPLPRSANFNDSAAVFRPHGDVLIHIAAHAGRTHPKEAGLARWLFDHLHADVPPGTEISSGTFGFFNEANFLSLLLYPRAVAPLSPEEADLSTLQSFDCGETYVRGGWQGRTILAIKGETEPLRAKTHRHRDSGSFILAHNRERILLDPGHGCYRSALRELDLRTDFHNTCTFS